MEMLPPKFGFDKRSTISSEIPMPKNKLPLPTVYQPQKPDKSELEPSAMDEKYFEAKETDSLFDIAKPANISPEVPKYSSRHSSAPWDDFIEPVTK